MTFRSIRSRMLLWLGLLLVCLLSGFGVTAYQLHRNNLLNQVDQELERRVAAISADALFHGPGTRDRFGGEKRGEPRPPREHPRDSGPRGPPPDDSDRPAHSRKSSRTRKITLSTQTLGFFNETDTNGFYFAFWSRDGDLLTRSTNAPALVELPALPEIEKVIHYRLNGDQREVYHFTEMNECALVGRSIRTDLAALHRFGGWLAAAGAAVLIVGLGSGWVFAGHALRPVQQISAAANRISEGNLSERINVAETDSELGRLAGVLNATFARLEGAFAEQKQFTANASHEIRTPLAVLISEAQTTLARERTAAEYRETVENCLETAQQMRRLTESLLQLARFDAGQEILERNPLNLSELTQECVTLIRPLAAQQRIQIHCSLAPAQLQGDANRLRQVIVNLLSNAIYHNQPEGEIQVRTESKNGHVSLIVSNTGPGIAPEDLPHIFERFYRADKSRSQANGRNGLGLAICQAIVAAHGGSIEVSSQPGASATFKVCLPA